MGPRIVGIPVPRSSELRREGSSVVQGLNIAVKNKTGPWKRFVGRHPLTLRMACVGGSDCTDRAGKEGFCFLLFQLKFNARRTGRVIGRDLFKRENYPEGLVERQRFNSRLARWGGQRRGRRGESRLPPGDTLGRAKILPINKFKYMNI